MDKVVSQWGHLPGNAYKILMRMAKSALDEDQPPVSYLSREDLALALGRMMPDAPHCGDISPQAEQQRKQKVADEKAVADAIRALKEASALTSQTRGKAGRRAEYALWLDRMLPESKYENRTPGKYENPTRAGHENRTPDPTKTVPPRTTQNNQGRGGGPKSPKATTSPEIVEIAHKTRPRSPAEEKEWQLRGLEALPDFRPLRGAA